MNEESIFAEAITIESAEHRGQFLDSACGDNLELRQAVEKLLKLSDHAGSFLEHPVLEGHADALEGINPAVIYGSRSTHFDQNDASIPGNTMNQNSQQPDDDILLGYLEPATREDSFGRLGHYEVLNVVGKGAFGTVLRAFDTKLERIVAIKVLALKMASMSPARKRFLREARTSARIRHENVVSIHSVEEEPTPYLVMEYIPGRTLQQQLEEHGPLDLPRVLRLGKQIADGLAAAHAQGLIHRDIKPGNMLLEGDMEERIKITDFGLARTVDDASMTQSGIITGTPMYMAPEQAHGHKLDQRADLFSLGSVLYQMISGRPPFRAPTTMAVLKRVTEDTPRPIQEIIPETPAWMCELIGHLHAKNPAERFSSAQEVSELLARCADDLQAGRTPEIPDPSKTAEATPVDVSQTRPRRSESLLQGPLAKIAAAVLIMLGLLGTTEATGVTELASTVIRLTTGSGTLVIETDDPGVKVAIDGQEVTITGGGVEELTLRPGEYKVAALKDGKRVKQELVSITRNGRTVVRMSLEPAATNGKALDTRSVSDWGGWPADAPPPAIVPFDAEQAKSHQQAWAEYFDLPVEYENSIGMKFRLVPAGEFMMGTSQEEIDKLLAAAKEQKRPDWFIKEIPREAPQHKVTLTKPFSLCTHQVTRGQFRQFVEATGYKTDAEEDGKGGYGRENDQWVQSTRYLWNTKLGLEPEQTDDHPVINVSWNDAVAFCEWLSKEAGGTYRLPTEAQWEFACRAGNPGWYSFGDDESRLADYAWYAGHGGLGTKPVGQKAPNAFGLHDMHGNVWEWCGDEFGVYDAGHVIDPVGTNRFQLRVARGGAFSTQPSAVRSARRSDGMPTTRYIANGFRVVLVAGSINQLQDKKSVSRSAEKSTTGQVLFENTPAEISMRDSVLDLEDGLRTLHRLRVNRKPKIEEANKIVEKLLANFPDHEATIHGQAAHLFGQSGIREFSDEVRKHALQSIKTETDIVERARMFMYLSNAEEVQGKPSEANYWALRGLLDLQPLNLPQVAPDPPGVGRFNDLVANPGAGNDYDTRQKLYQRLSAAEKQAHDSAIQVRELVRFRNIYVDILRRLNTTTEAIERLQQLARERIGSDWLQKFLKTSFDRHQEDSVVTEQKADDDLPRQGHAPSVGTSP